MAGGPNLKEVSSASGVYLEAGIRSHSADV